MPEDISPLFKLLADELEIVTHSSAEEKLDEVFLSNYRREQQP